MDLNDSKITAGSTTAFTALNKQRLSEQKQRDNQQKVQEQTMGSDSIGINLLINIGF